MTNDEQVAICKAIARSCMWGQGGIGSVILDELQKRLPMGRPWQEVYREHQRQTEYEAVGIVKDEAEISYLLSRGYWLTNYSPGELAVFNPPPMNGLHKYITGELADRYGAIHDAWNFNVYKQRAAERTKA